MLLRHYATETNAPKLLAELEQRLQQLSKNRQDLTTEVYNTISSKLASSRHRASVNDVPSTTPPSTTVTQDGFKNKRDYDNIQDFLRKKAKTGSALRVAYDPQTAFKHPPTASQLTLPMLMAAQTHLGHATPLWNPRNSSYIFGIRDGIHIISLDTTYAYLRRAAKVVQEVARRGGIILFVGTRDKQEEIVVRAASVAGGYHIFDRWVPGALTNGQQILGHCRLKVVNVQDNELSHLSSLMKGENGHPVLKPDLVVCLNPLENEVCLHECGLHTVPTIGVIDTDADPSWVTYPIPANDDSLRCITLIAGVLSQAAAQGQSERQRAAQAGLATYDTDGVKQMLKNMEKLANLRVEKDTESTSDTK